MQEARTLEDGNGKEAGVENEEESKENAVSRAVRGYGGEIDREEQRQHRADSGRVREQHIRRATLVRRRTIQRQPDEAHHWKDQEDRGGERQLACSEELRNPAPLVYGRYAEADGGEQRPPPFVGDPGESRIEEQQVAEQPDWVVLTGGDDRR